MLAGGTGAIAAPIEPASEAAPQAGSNQAPLVLPVGQAHTAPPQQHRLRGNERPGGKPGHQSEEAIHHRENGPGPPSRGTSSGQGEIGNQPASVTPQGASDTPDDPLQYLRRKTVQEEMGHHEVESRPLGNPPRQGSVLELHPPQLATGYRTSRHLEHFGARIDADKACRRQGPQRRRQEAPVSFSRQQCPARSANVRQPSDSGTLEPVTGQNRLHPPVMACEPVETHPQALGWTANRFHHSPEANPPAAYASTSRTSPVTGNTLGPITSNSTDQTARWVQISDPRGGRS